MFGGNASYKEEQFNFLRSLQHDRFPELQRNTGAYQGEAEINRNQLLDAFHLWCSEHNACGFFSESRFQTGASDRDVEEQTEGAHCQAIATTRGA